MQKFSIGSFNVRNLALPNVEYYPGEKYSQKVYGEKVKWVSEQIIKMECDIIGFQEIFHEEALKECLKDTPLDNANIYIAENIDIATNKKGPSLAIVSKYPLANSRAIPKIPDSVVNALSQYTSISTFSRPILTTDIAITADKSITVLVTHLKSKGPSFTNDTEEDNILMYHYGEARSLMRRAAEAAGLREIIIENIKGNQKPLICMGDLNDSMRAVTTEMICGPYTFKNMDEAKKKSIWDVKLYDAFDILTQKTLSGLWYSHIYNGFYEVLDHICFSEEFYYRNTERIWDIDNVRVLNDHLVDETNMNVRQDLSKSDHGQVSVKIKEYIKKP